MKKYGCSLRLRRIRQEFHALHRRSKEALESGDREGFDRYHREFCRHCFRYQWELQIPDERIEEMRVDLLKRDILSAKEAHLEAQLERLRREADEEDRKLDEMLLAEEKRGRLKWN
jgi:hypothetical protein